VQPRSFQLSNAILATGERNIVTDMQVSGAIIQAWFFWGLPNPIWPL
jgi:hypothetical protein